MPTPERIKQIVAVIRDLDVVIERELLAQWKTDQHLIHLKEKRTALFVELIEEEYTNENN